MGTHSVLCRYFLHGACSRGAACPFSHDMADAESQVCTFYLKGDCRYGDRCRYLHTKPEWSQRAGAGAGAGSSGGYSAPAAPRPAADDLSEQLPISRLRLGGQAPDAAPVRPSRGGARGQGGAQPPLPLPVPLPLAVELPPDPFGSAQSGGSAFGDDGGSQGGGEPGGASYAEQEGGWVEHGYAGDYGHGEEHGEQQAAWHSGGGGGGGEEGGYWEEGQQGGYGYEGGEGYWPEDEQEGAWAEGEPWCGEYGGGGGEGYGEEHGGGGSGAAQQHAGLQPPAGAWSLPAGGADEQQAWAAGVPASLRSLCMQWFKSGACPKGSRCQLVHGEQCPHCGKHALHPADPDQRQQHLAECRLRHERLAARARSAVVECGICLEPVTSKAAPGDRKFGLLTGCDHPFCLRCIRSWRGKTDAGADIDSERACGPAGRGVKRVRGCAAPTPAQALRTCPVCRTTSHYIVPSLVWPTSGEEKERIVAGYRAKLASIHCQYFDRGAGSCPFGTSCFYRHEFPDGRLEEPSLRKAADEEGVIRVVQPVRLSDFIEFSTAGQRLGRRRR